MKSVLSIAGSDPSGGAGIQADLKTFQHFDVYGMAAISLLTIQNTLGIQEILVIHPDKIKAQILAVLSDIKPNVIKLGALGHAPSTMAVSNALQGYDGVIVSDPVMLSKNNAPLLTEEALEVYKKNILPRCFLVTPNLDEASKLSGMTVKTLSEMKESAKKMHVLGAKNVLVKGGHLDGSEAIDVLYDGNEYFEYKSVRVETSSTHGVGCTLASAIASNLALGQSLPKALSIAKQYITKAIQRAPGLGSGNGPINHQG